jgi:phosphatidylglycerol lysyltransferase
MGFFVNEMGPENRLDLNDYDFSGRSKRALRLSINRAAKLGYVTRECSLKSLDSGEVQAVSDAWRRQRTVRTREISFLNRPMVFEDEVDVRKFFMFDAGGKIIAFSSYDPIYQGGRIVGYCNHIKRHLPGTDSLVANAMTCHVIATFKEEGLKCLLLGISPFADIKGIDDDAFRRSWWVWRCFRTAYRNPLLNRFVYPLRSLHEHKRQYCGITEQTYYATNRRPSLIRVLKMARACGIV